MSNFIIFIRKIISLCYHSFVWLFNPQFSPHSISFSASERVSNMFDIVLTNRYPLLEPTMESRPDLPKEIVRRFAAENPWTLRFTQAALASAQRLTEIGDLEALRVISEHLKTFPPPARMFTMRMDLTGGNLQVWAKGGPHLKLRVSALYRLMHQECAITHVERL
jgi:hypothetical protein